MYLTYTTRMMESRRDGFDEGCDKGREDGLQSGLLAGLQQGIKQGLEQGVKQGAYQKALETARKLLARGYPADDIADLLGLPISQIQELQ